MGNTNTYGKQKTFKTEQNVSKIYRKIYEQVGGWDFFEDFDHDDNGCFLGDELFSSHTWST